MKHFLLMTCIFRSEKMRSVPPIPSVLFFPPTAMNTILQRRQIKFSLFLKTHAMQRFQKKSHSDFGKRKMTRTPLSASQPTGQPHQKTWRSSYKRLHRQQRHLWKARLDFKDLFIILCLFDNFVVEQVNQL